TEMELVQLAAGLKQGCGAFLNYILGLYIFSASIKITAKWQLILRDFNQVRCAVRTLRLGCDIEANVCTVNF
ncbi:MAG: hypothetical protein KY448_04730, partial [Cyanobacteria bacterium 0813]|nr:hypothetical protein [Cyanobacteria bacterium 0813]